MSWQILLAINLVFATVREFLSKKNANRLDPIIASFFFSLFTGILLIGYQLAVKGSWPRWDLSIMFSGLIFVAALISYFAAVKISLSQTILFQSYSIVVTILLSAIFLGEGQYLNIATSLGQRVIGGILMAFSALWFLLHEGGSKEQRLEKRWVGYILVHILTGGIGTFISIGLARKILPAEVFSNQSVAIVVLLGILMMWKKLPILQPKKVMQSLFLQSFAGTVALLSFYEALIQEAVALVYPVQQVSLVVITMIIGIVVYKEQRVFSGKRLVGMVLGMAGIILLLTT